MNNKSDLSSNKFIIYINFHIVLIVLNLFL